MAWSKAIEGNGKFPIGISRLQIIFFLSFVLWRAAFPRISSDYTGDINDMHGR